MSHRITSLLCCAALISASAASLSARSGIIPSPAGSPWQYHAEAGLSTISGLDNVLDQMEKNFGYDRDSSWPVGVKVAAYARHENGFAVGGSLGPCAFVRVEDDRHHYHRHDDDDRWSYVIPLTADVRYFFPSSGGFTPYVRGGISFPISGGDDLSGGTPGPVIAVGAHVWEHRVFSLGVEIGYDASKVKVKAGPFRGAAEVRPVEFSIGVFASI